MSAVKTPALNHEARYHAMKDGTVKKALIDIPQKILDGVGRLVDVQLNDDIALVAVQHYLRICHEHSSEFRAPAPC
ncbi:hypothetical protein GGI1_13969 [Acidithiobacillus sp. GGI-221]|nr:hypothetical protein GGI1_13969 [Acidithiobacillus sp. GGI-221]